MTYCVDCVVSHEFSAFTPTVSHHITRFVQLVARVVCLSLEIELIQRRSLFV